MRIGPHAFENPLALAPMVGVTDRFFRQLCKNLGAAYVVSEMLAANPALRNSDRSRLRGDFEGQDEPIAVQIAGSVPEWMADAAHYNVSRGAQIIDINMGCPAKKVCNKLAGSALLSEPELVRKILDAVISAVNVPVTLKIRTGPTPLSRNGVAIAQLAEQAGVAALAVHGRTRSDRFRGEAEYDTIREICENVTIPVFANGDIDSPRKAATVLRHTGAAGLMIGRAAQGNPWIFREIQHFLATGRLLPPPRSDEVMEVLERHLEKLHQTYGEYRGVRVARRHIGWYLGRQSRSSAARAELMRVDTAAEQFHLIRTFFSGISAADEPEGPGTRKAA